MINLKLFPYRKFADKGWQPIYTDERCMVINDNIPTKIGLYFILFASEFSNCCPTYYSSYSFGIAYFDGYSFDIDFSFRHLHVGGVMGNTLMYKEVDESMLHIVQNMFYTNTTEDFDKIKKNFEFFDILKEEDDYLGEKPTYTESEPFNVKFKKIKFRCKYGEELGNCCIWLDGYKREHAFIVGDYLIIKNYFDFIDLYKTGPNDPFIQDNLLITPKDCVLEAIRLTSNEKFPKYDYVCIKFNIFNGMYFNFSINDFNKYFELS